MRQKGNFEMAAVHKCNASRARTRTGKWHTVFLATLKRTPSVTLAARAANVSRRAAYDQRARDPKFAKAWEDALQKSIDLLEHAVYVRAVKEDVQLAMFLLEAHRPALYRDPQVKDLF
jgi:hypothetical protein